MAYKDEEVKKAEELYCIEGLKLEEIERIANIPYTTLNRWRQEKKWDKKKEACNFNFEELADVYVKRMQEIILDIENNKINLLDPSVADAFAKNISVIQKIKPTKKQYGLILSFIKKVDEYLLEKDKDLREKMMKHWEGIKERLLNYLEYKK